MINMFRLQKRDALPNIWKLILESRTQDGKNWVTHVVLLDLAKEAIKDHGKVTHHVGMNSLS